MCSTCQFLFTSSLGLTPVTWIFVSVSGKILLVAARAVMLSVQQTQWQKNNNETQNYLPLATNSLKAQLCKCAAGTNQG